MLAKLALFIPAAILTNTAFPMPFDHVLIWFCNNADPQRALLFCLVGALCAGVAAMIDLALASQLARLVKRETPRAPRSFYLWAGLLALAPVPYTVVRLSLIATRPNPHGYALAVIVGRLPRYLATAFAWAHLALPSWAATALLLSAVPFVLWSLMKSKRNKASNASSPG